MRIIRAIGSVVAVVGVFTMLGALGQSDYCTEIGEYIPLIDTIKMMLTGAALTSVGVAVNYLGEDND